MSHEMRYHRSYDKIVAYKTEYGSVKIVGHRKVDGVFALQITEYTSDRTGETEEETIHCDGSRDFSSHEGIKYNSDCHFCFAGVGHTVERHSRATK